LIHKLAITGPGCATRRREEGQRSAAHDERWLRNTSLAAAGPLAGSSSVG
jgi:hypothetical protein